MLSGSSSIAIIALLLTFVWGRFGEFYGNLVPHTWYQLGVMASVYLAATAKTPMRFLAAGVCIGLTALFEPTCLVLAVVALYAAARVPTAVGRRRARRTALLSCSVLCWAFSRCSRSPTCSATRTAPSHAICPGL